MDIASTSLLAWTFGLAALGYAVLTGYLFSFGNAGLRTLRSRRVVVMAGVSVIWALLTLRYALVPHPLTLLTSLIFDVVRYGAGYAFLIALLTPATVDQNSLRPIAPWLPTACISIVITGVALQFAFALGLMTPAEWLRLLIFHGLAEAVVGLILIEQLFRDVTDDARWNLKPLCLALFFQFAFDIYLFSDALMFGRIDTEALAARAFLHAITIPLLMLATERSRDWTSKIRLSQKAAFHSVTLLFAGVYLLFMAAIGYYVRYFGGEWGHVLQTGLLLIALLFLGILMLSGSMRARMKVLVGKHFFRYRYDYREEWLRFTRTLSVQDSSQNMGQQVIRGLADMVESPAGALWLHDAARRSFRQYARWNLPECAGEVAVDSSLMNFLSASGWVINLEEYRSSPARYQALELPIWLSEFPNAWLIVPLQSGPEINGFVILASARTPISINWEVNDLLRTAGSQAGSFLARVQATEALLEVRKFDAFNKMSAFVVHDLKNIVTQLALMLKNAERHRDNPEFQQDMLMTVDHAVERMRQLMLQLREGATPPGVACGVNLSDTLQNIVKDKASQGRAMNLSLHERLFARGHDERLTRVIGHLIQNALDATATGGDVAVSLSKRHDKAAIDICDSGVGMSPEFIRDRLFRPFQSTKSAGMGIGAYESAQYIRELGGDIEVESQLGQGTRITVLLPLFSICTESDLQEKEAA
jgi:putative PEP-CTERM system histidine kinase